MVAVNADITATGGALSGFSGSGSTYSAIFTPTADSTTPGQISVAADKFQDADTNPNLAAALATAITIDTAGPTISSVTSATLDGTYGPGQNITLILELSESVTVDTAQGLPQLVLNTIPIRSAIFVSAANNQLVFTYTVQDGDASSDLDVTGLSLNGAVIEDAAGNAASFSGIATQLNSAAAIVIDTTAPDAPTVDVQTTNSTPPTITGTNSTLAADEVLSVVVNGATYEVTPTGTPTTTWSLDLAAAVPTSGTLGAFADGTYAVTATVTDEVGNTESSTSVANALVVDTTAPAAPTVDALVARNLASPTLTGTVTLSEGDILTVNCGRCDLYDVGCWWRHNGCK